MIYLLGQIVLCLLLATLGGWFIGWSWRGFRESDRVEDIRRTLRATEEVKDRELAEVQRHADTLHARVETLERRAERLADELAQARSEGPPAEALRVPPEILDDPGDEPTEHELEPARSDPYPDDRSQAVLLDSEAPELPDPAGLVAEERERRAAAERALRDKTGALLEHQAELANLRAGARDRAAELARLEKRLVELEPLERQLEDRTDEVAALRAELERTREGASDEDARLRDLDTRATELEAAILERDRRINELRQRYQDTAARLEVAEADQTALRARMADSLHARREDDGVEVERCRRDLSEARREAEELRAALKRQIERNRKQETVHQQVVANLRAEARETEAGVPPPSAPRSGRVDHDARVRQIVADRDAHIASLRARIGELETEPDSRPGESDDLQAITGIGPRIADLLRSIGVTRYDQIAAWTEEDVERIGARLGAFEGRIRRDDWMGQARRLRDDDPAADADR